MCQECGAKNLEDARFCSSCGTPLVAVPRPPVALQTRPFDPQQPGPFDPQQPAAPHVPPVAAQPARPKQRFFGFMKPTKRGLMKTCLFVPAALVALVVSCAGISALVSDDDHHRAAVVADSRPAAVEDEPGEPKALAGEEVPAEQEAAPAEASDQPIPEQQAAFIQTVESFYQPYQEASNELQGSAQRPKRSEALAVLLPNRTVQGWTGTLESLDTDSRGNAYISIRPDGTDSIIIATWNNALADVGTNSMIPSGSDLYNKLAEMSVGDRVAFNGTFAAGDEDHVAEGSLTEAGSMTTPAFVMVFSDVTRQE